MPGPTPVQPHPMRRPRTWPRAHQLAAQARHGPNGTAVLDEPGAVEGDPLSVPERELDDEPEFYPQEDGYPRVTTVIPVRLPPELAQYVDLEYRHDEEVCPAIVATFHTATLTGPPEAWLELGRLFAAIASQGPCVRCMRERARGEAAHASAASRAG